MLGVSTVFDGRDRHVAGVGAGIAGRSAIDAGCVADGDGVEGAADDGVSGSANEGGVAGAVTRSLMAG